MDRALGLTGGKQGTTELLNVEKTLLRNQPALLCPCFSLCARVTMRCQLWKGSLVVFKPQPRCAAHRLIFTVLNHQSHLNPPITEPERLKQQEVLTALSICQAEDALLHGVTPVLFSLGRCRSSEVQTPVAFLGEGRKCPAEVCLILLFCLRKPFRFAKLGLCHLTFCSNQIKHFGHL